MKEKLINELVASLRGYIPDQELRDIKMKFSITMKDYEVSSAKHEVTVWKGDENEMMLRRFLAAKIAKGCSVRTIQFYKQSIAHTLLRIGKKYCDITSEDIRLYLAERVYKDGISKTTANNERRNLSSFFGWLQVEEILLKNPMKKIEVLKETRKKKEAFKDIDIERLRGACRTNRERALIEVMLSTWCRASELVQIRRDDIRGEEVIVHGKGDKDRKVYLNAKARFAITQYLQERKDANSYLFPKLADSKRLKSRSAITPDWYQTAENVDPDDPMGSGTVNGLVKQIGKKGGVENTHAHRFRRTGATLALRHGMPLTTVSKILGHASIETTQIYLDISDEEMKDAHRKYVN